MDVWGDQLAIWGDPLDRMIEYDVHRSLDELISITGEKKISVKATRIWRIPVLEG